MHDNDETKENAYIQCLSFNNQYGGALSLEWNWNLLKIFQCLRVIF